MDKKAVLEIKIEFNGPVLEFKSRTGEVKMIPFKGTCECDAFHGIVEPCGVDTQVLNQAGVRHMSARYMLTGKDSEGNDAHIYIENNGWFEEAHRTKPFHTVPTFYTDSPVLEELLCKNSFEGIGSTEDGTLYIRFYLV